MRCDVLWHFQAHHWFDKESMLQNSTSQNTNISILISSAIYWILQPSVPRLITTSAGAMSTRQTSTSCPTVTSWPSCTDVQSCATSVTVSKTHMYLLRTVIDWASQFTSPSMNLRECAPSPRMHPEENPNSAPVIHEIVIYIICPTIFLILFLNLMCPWETILIDVFFITNYGSFW